VIARGRADGLTFTARARHGGQVRTDCPVAAVGLGARGWDVEIGNRPERAEARACVACGGDHR
jgi:hypothetical protein